MNKFASLSALQLFVSIAIFAQVSISTDNSAPDNSAMLEVKSNNKGFLPPRMTQSDIMTIQNPSDGLIAYCITDGKLYVDAGGSWTGWDGPWNSDLKLHVAGVIYFINGSLIDRGYIGYYWSSSNYANDYGWMLYFTSGSSLVDFKRKGYGGTIRCLRE